MVGKELLLCMREMEIDTYVNKSYPVHVKEIDDDSLTVSIGEDE